MRTFLPYQLRIQMVVFNKLDLTVDWSQNNPDMEEIRLTSDLLLDKLCRIIVYLICRTTENNESSYNVVIEYLIQLIEEDKKNHAFFGRIGKLVVSLTCSLSLL